MCKNNILLINANIYIKTIIANNKGHIFKEIKKIYKTYKLTTNGPQINILEKLKKILGVKNLILVSNGTLAIIALEALKIKNKVIITPFSYISTANAVEWQKKI